MTLAVLERQDDLQNTCQQLIGNSIPNLLRLYLNPWVCCTCLSLNHYAQRLCLQQTDHEDCASFFANSLEEALSGAIKLARYHTNRRDPKTRNATAIIVDSTDRLPHFGYSVLGDERQVDYVPGIVRCRHDEFPEVAAKYSNAGIVVLADEPDSEFESVKVREYCEKKDVFSIQCVSCLNFVPGLDIEGRRTDIAVFDESFVNGEVAFAAFTARQSLFSDWWTGAMSMFHSTTFQPNSITTSHFVNCLAQRDPETSSLLTPLFEELKDQVSVRHEIYQRFFSPSLSKLIATTQFDIGEPTVSGHTIDINGRKIFDGVAGVACSLRGHNPVSFSSEISHRIQTSEDLAEDLREALYRVSGLSHFVPAVSGASAVEQALQIALCCRSRRPRVVALTGGFGGKTLGALTGTSRERYKQHLEPLYQPLSYVDPFSADAEDQLRRLVDAGDVGVVQMELIQGVGGVRQVPQSLVDLVVELRHEHQFLLFLDEVQTGFYRTGPFARCLDLGVEPDILTLGKGTSDTMLPFALTLFNESVAGELDSENPGLADHLRRRFALPASYAAVLNSLERAARDDWEVRVRRQSTLLRDRLRQKLERCANVKEVRVFGMLSGIELDQTRFANRMLGKRAARLFSLAMLNHPCSPLLMGFCQYEPHVFKLTPGLLMDDEEIEAVCETIVQTLNRSTWSVLAEGAKALAALAFRKKKPIATGNRGNSG